MMLDEEARSNARMTVPPKPPAPPSIPQEGMDPEMAAEQAAAVPQTQQAQSSRPASPVEEKMFATLAKQALQFLTTEQASDHLLAAAQAQGPEQALAAAVTEAVGGVMQAAEAGGVKVSPQVQGAATQVVVTALSALMAEGGLTDDPQALATTVMSSMNGEPQDGPAA